MKFVAEKDALAAAVARAARGASSRASNPILAGVLLEVGPDSLRLTGTDLDTTIFTSIPVMETEKGTVVVAAKLLADVVKSLPGGAVTVEMVDESTLSIHGARAKFSLRTFNGNEFPTLSAPTGPQASFDAKDFLAAVKQTIFAASTDAARPLLTGVLFESSGPTLRMVSTDSYRMVVRDLPDTKSVDGVEDVLIPAFALQEAVRLIGTKPDGEVWVTFGSTQVALTHKGTTILSRLLEGTYPAYRNLMPESYSYEVAINKADMLDAVKRVALLVSDNTTPLRLDLSAEKVGLSVKAMEVGTSDEDVDVAEHLRGDEELTIAFNPRYLAESINAVTTEDFLLCVETAHKPAAIRESGSTDFLSLLMPVKLS